MKSAIPWLLVILPGYLLAGTFTAATCNVSDVSAVINGPTHTAVDGDIINIPGGTCVWAAQLSVPVGISIIGAGSSSTIIQDSFGGALFSVAIPSATSSLFRFSGVTITPMGALNTTIGLFAINGTCSATTCSHIRLDNLNITGWTSASGVSFLMDVNNVFGVIDHNTFSYVGVIVMDISHSNYGGVLNYGDNSWAQPDSFGTDNALYIETNTITTTGTNGDAITDTDHGGGRYVGRFNTITNSSFQTHGTETTGRNRGGRAYEIYSNNVTLNSGAAISLIGIRSGVGLVFNNTKSGAGQFNTAASLALYRVNNSFPPWGVCAGQGLYDQNDGVVHASGTVTATSLSGTTLSVTDTSQSWTASQWVAVPPYSVVDIDRTDSAGFHPSAEIASSTSNNVTSTNYGAFNPSLVLPFTVGDHYQILRALACLDQPGRGGNGAVLLSGSTPAPTGWVNEPISPIYEWGDTISGGGAPPFGWLAPNATTLLAANVDYYSQASPFTGASGTGTGTLASRPTTCTAGVAYWATDQGSWNTSGSGGQGQLYVCNPTNTWTLYYTPYTYPHPLVSSAPPVAPTITTTSPLPGGTVGVAYNLQFTASGTAPITWSATGTPVGLSVSSTGLLSGTPTMAGGATINVTASNSAGMAGPMGFAITISPGTPSTTVYSGALSGTFH